MASNVIDYHCHLDLYPDPETAISECERMGIYTLSVTTTPKAWPRNHEWISKTHFVRAALGIHPQLVATRANEITIWETYLSQTRYVGEVGLDGGPRFYQSLDLQKSVFQKILTLSDKAGGKILSVHSARTTTLVLDMIEKYMRPGRCQVVLHWFTGTKSEASRAIDLGCYFSINAEMFAKKQHHSTIESLPLNRLLTETDGPFCKINNRPVRPADASRVVELIAEELGLTPDVIANNIYSNLMTIETHH
jgi:TatD DNase family protein